MNFLSFGRIHIGRCISTHIMNINRLSGIRRETPLSYAVMGGHKNVVGQLLGTNRIGFGGWNYWNPKIARITLGVLLVIIVRLQFPLFI